MTCEEFEDLAGAYTLDDVTPAQRQAAAAHLASCCAGYLVYLFKNNEGNVRTEGLFVLSS